MAEVPNVDGIYWVSTATSQHLIHALTEYGNLLAEMVDAVLKQEKNVCNECVAISKDTYFVDFKNILKHFSFN